MRWSRQRNLPSTAPTDTARDLPVAEILQPLLTHLAQAATAVVMAPPGAGKTTRVPLALLAAEWCAAPRKIVVLVPRRLAARAAAEHVAGLLGEVPGATVGYRTRLDVRPGRRIEYVTTGLLLNRLLAEPELGDVGALLFDEVHERSLDLDLALALALDLQQLRPDLRLLAMSATLDGERVAALLGGARQFRCSGRSFPVSCRYLGRSRLADLPRRMASAIHLAVAAETGSVLAFLPGVGEIERTAELLELPADVRLCRLHAQLDAREQRLALQPGGRKVVLATSIAETSLTVDGVRTVVDSGFARRPEVDRASGFSRLQTVRVSRAAASQRAGRAGRQAPGQVLRLWDEAETLGLLPFDPPEILGAELAGLVLRTAAWGVRDPAELRWLDPPPAAAVAAARTGLQAMGALDEDGRLTAHGRRLVQLPLAPARAHLLLLGAQRGQAELAAQLVLLLEEQGLGGRAVDLDVRLANLRRAGDRRSRQMLALAGRWQRTAEGLLPADGTPPLPAALLLATASPAQVTRRRRSQPDAAHRIGYRMASGRGVEIAAAEPLAKAEWLLVADAGGHGAAARVRLAAAIDAADLDGWLAGRTRTSSTLARDAGGRWRAQQRVALGAIELTVTDRPPEPAQLAAALLAEAQAGALADLQWPAAEWMRLARLRFLAALGVAPELPDLSDAGLWQAAGEWLLPRLQGLARLADVQLEGALLDWLGWPARRLLEAQAPEYFHSPAGSHHAIDYLAPGGPEVEVRAQALFGLGAHPRLAGGVPLVLVLTSPAGRPLARTRDIAAFWNAGWRDVQRQMKGRYPKHPWPDDPLAAPPTLRSKAAQRRPQ